MRNPLNDLKILIFICACTLLGCDSDAQMNTDAEVDFSASSFGEFLEKVNALDSAAKVEVVSNFLDTIESAPVIENGDAYFFYAGSATRVQVAGDFTGWSPNGRSFTQVHRYRFMV